MLRMLLLICLIVLASVGIGLAGGVPIPLSSKREDKVDVNVELIESKDQEEDAENYDQEKAG